MTETHHHIFSYMTVKRRIELVGQKFKEERPITGVSFINNEYKEIGFIWQKCKAGIVKEKAHLF